ncbi:MAG: Preprotein translocase subunit SecF/Preprotein translocase subunit SecF [Chloroflexi bacterium]|jgi:preprotein translocase subunit SecF|nr:MAG: Preprotein translocase subunit SecF/Preprotein translocase subunit SecF [Chloroflexota bacterium]
MINFVGLRRYFAMLSLLVLAPCLVALALWQLNPGIDFDGGLELEVRVLRDVNAETIVAAGDDAGIEGVVAAPTDEGSFLVSVGFETAGQPDGIDQDLLDALEAAIGPTEAVDARLTDGDLALEVEFWFPADVTQDDVRDVARDAGVADARIQETGDSTFKIRAEEPDGGNIEDVRQDLEAALGDNLGDFFVLSSSAVSGILSAEIAVDAAIALVIAAFAILIYISMAFRRLPNPALYGAAAIIALLHDITVVVGVFSILGELADIEVNAMFVTALLAIIGYSVNDTIVVFDRIRENRLANPKEEFRISVNAAVTQSLGRSLNTSLTLIFALVALLLIGGVTVRPFVLVILVGAMAGTYSSIGVASQILVLWSEGSFHRFLRVGPRPLPAAAPDAAAARRVSA